MPANLPICVHHRGTGNALFDKNSGNLPKIHGIRYGNDPWTDNISGYTCHTHGLPLCVRHHVRAENNRLMCLASLELFASHTLH